MNRITFAAAAVLALVPVVAHATVYRLDATVAGTPEDFGTIGVADSIVAGGRLDLHRLCRSDNACNVTGPWDQVTLDLAGGLEPAITGSGAGTVADFLLLFGTSGDVTGGRIEVSGSEAHTGGTYLNASLGSTIDSAGICSGPELCGTYLPVVGANRKPVSIAFVQQQSNTLSQPVPEPAIGLPLLLFGLLGLTALRVRTSVRNYT